MTEDFGRDCKRRRRMEKNKGAVRRPARKRLGKDGEYWRKRENETG